ncbi:MAG: uracil-DNA glycosylase, partial [Pseudomonadota bacterium]
VKPKPVVASTSMENAPAVIGAAEAMVESKKLAAACTNLDELKQAIANFDGLSVKKTATNMVFSDGNPKADIMLIGEAPGADEDAQGKPFVGASGQLLDKILASIGLARDSKEIDKAVYISNILNWRPPGNRTPTAQEIEISLPFIEKHIELVSPKYLILCGAVPGKSLLNQKASISKLRGKFHEYQAISIQNTAQERTILALATYHPAYLLRTPAQKRAVWADMLMLKSELYNS